MIEPVHHRLLLTFTFKQQNMGKEPSFELNDHLVLQTDVIWFAVLQVNLVENLFLRVINHTCFIFDARFHVGCHRADLMRVVVQISHCPIVDLQVV
tara:strand:- start:1516 stop:1803 length:288 start_codon:yes stop_codon:yes gene_type:complete